MDQQMDTEQQTLMVAQGNIDVENKDNILFQPSLASAEDETRENSNMEDIGAKGEHVEFDRSLPKVRCCMCGLLMSPNGNNTCINCLKGQIDITEGIPKSIVLHHCKECNRYQRPPWTQCELESPQLLALCLKKVKGMKGIKLLDAGFQWTEPHSRRIKVKLTVQKEVANNTSLQQTFIIEFKVTNLQCDDCKQQWTPHQWVAQVQVRQRVDHKRTFLFLEQKFIKHNTTEKCINIRDKHDGLDFEFKNRSHGIRLVDFVQNSFVSTVSHSKQLVSHDEQNNSYKYKYTFILELATICKDDLAILPKALSRQLGGIGPLVLVYKITQFVHIVDVNTMQTFEIDNITYWKNQFKGVCTRDRLTNFIVLEIDEPIQDPNVSRAAARQKMRQIQVTVCREEDLGQPDKTFVVHSHLGEILKHNDTVCGYDLAAINLADVDEFDKKCRNMPDVVLVRKIYPKVRKAQKTRFWKLKRFENVQEEGDDMEMQEGGVENKKQPKMTRKEKNHQARKERDYNEFLQDLDEDPEMRQQIDLYKDHDVIAQLEKQIAGLDINETAEKKDDERVIKKAARKTDQGKKLQQQSKDTKKKNQQLFKATLKQGQNNDEEDSDWESVEEDFPAVKLEDLLDNLKLNDNNDQEESKQDSDDQEDDF